MNHPHAPNPSETHAAAWKARALAALRGNSSLSVRLARYNAAMVRARNIEARVERQQLTSDPHEALAWLKDDSPVRINAAKPHDRLRHVRSLAELEAKEIAHV